MAAVERLGDDEAEHRVAEELQPLVGGQAAVLVGVRAVRQGALEQLGVQDVEIPERRAQSSRRRSAAALTDRSEDLATVGAGAVLAALRRTHGAAGAWRRRPGWRRSPGSARRPSTASDGGACCCATSSASEQPRVSLLVRATGSSVVRSAGQSGAAVVLGRCQAASAAHRGSTAPRARGPGRRQPRPALGAQPGTVVPAQRLERQCEHHRVPQQRLEVEQVVLEPAASSSSSSGCVVRAPS